jgi:hypothetical protein
MTAMRLIFLEISAACWQAGVFPHPEQQPGASLAEGEGTSHKAILLQLHLTLRASLRQNDRCKYQLIREHSGS